MSHLAFALLQTKTVIKYPFHHLHMTLEIPEEIDEPRQIMYDELVEEHGEEAIQADLINVVHQRLTNLYDNNNEATTSQ